MGLTVVNDEILAPVLGLASGLTHYPWQAHARGLVGHLVLGATTDTVLDVLDPIQVKSPVLAEQTRPPVLRLDAGDAIRAMARGVGFRLSHPRARAAGPANPMCRFFNGGV